MKLKNKTQPQFLRLLIFAVFLIATLALLIVGIKIVTPSITTLSYQKSLATAPRIEFPDINTAGFSDQQNALLALLRKQYDNPQPGTFYSEGVTESWCADFVSWNLNQLGMPLKNPNSGSWRIPGTYTLADYYRSINNLYGTANDTPEFGDVMIYKGDRYMGDHTNFVLYVRDGQITTIGGNENNAIHIQTHPLDDSRSIVGFAKTF